VTTAGPDVLGIPAPAGVITALSIVANTIVASSFILALGLFILMVATRAYGKLLGFLSELRGTIRRAFLPTLTVAIAGTFLSLLMEYLTPGHAFFFTASDLTERTDIFLVLSYIVKLIFLAGVSLAVGAAFITIVNRLRSGSERVTISGFRIICGAALVGTCARIADIWFTSNHHPATPELSGIILAGSVIAAAIIGTAIIGILRPRLPLWSIATATAILIGIFASSYINVHLANEAYRAAAPTFGPAYRIQPVLMILFFAFSGIGLGVIALTIKWWFSHSMPDTRYPMPEKSQ